MPISRHRKRLRPLLVVPPPAQANKPVRETQQLDVWLLRLSHFSQFGLFLFTVGAIYFTVIPLYQKALLDEAIAKKEVELKDANAALERAYARIRTEVVKDYVFFAGAECSGLFEPPEPLLPLGKPVPARLSRADKLLALDVPACLTTAAKESVSLQELRSEDRKLLDQRLLALGDEVLALRQRAIAAYKEFLLVRQRIQMYFHRPMDSPAGCLNFSLPVNHPNGINSMCAMLQLNPSSHALQLPMRMT